MAKSAYRRRRFMAFNLIFVVLLAVIFFSEDMWQPYTSSEPSTRKSSDVVAVGDAADALETILVKGRAPKTGYERQKFGDGWRIIEGCDTRNIILNRDLVQVVVDDSCKVQSGVLKDPYTNKTITFLRGPNTSADVQIDHVVALSDAWQKGAQLLSEERREELANDPLELLAVDGAANQEKGDGDAATWLPANKQFRCQYVARQIAVKQKYNLWMTSSEKRAVMNILTSCPGQTLPQE